MAVSGHQAVLGTEITVAGSPTALLLSVYRYLATGIPDVLGLELAGPPPVKCPPVGTPLAVNGPISIGGFTVIDSPPVPTDKMQCKNGGWKNFGPMFKDQGQCVTFVERGPKP